MRSRALAVRRTQRNKAINLSEEKLTEIVNARRGKKKSEAHIFKARRLGD